MRRDRRWHATRRAAPGGGPNDGRRPPRDLGWDVTVRDDLRDEDEFTALYESHHEILLAHALRLTGGDVTDAEETVVEVLHRAWQDPARRDRRPGAVRPWLILLTRAVHAERRGTAVPPPTQLPAPAASATIVAALNELSGVHRGVLVDLFYRGQTVEQVAAALGVPVATVKSRLYYALRALRLVLQHQDRRAEHR